MSFFGGSGGGLSILDSNLITFTQESEDIITQLVSAPKIYAKWKFDYGSVQSLRDLLVFYDYLSVHYKSTDALTNLDYRLQYSFDDVTYSSFLNNGGSGIDDNTFDNSLIPHTIDNMNGHDKVFVRLVAYVANAAHPGTISDLRMQCLFFPQFGVTMTRLI